LDARTQGTVDRCSLHTTGLQASTEPLELKEVRYSMTHRDGWTMIFRDGYTCRVGRTVLTADVEA